MRALDWVNAGHLPILLKRGSTVSQLASGGMPFGLLPGASYTCGCERLSTGDMFLLFTDGITEAGEELGIEEYGLQRLTQNLLREEEPESLLQAIADELSTHLRRGHPNDDVTMLCARCR
jgi:sigma-B regulation protein RsbU (phosphoserine phosphatase)